MKEVWIKKTVYRRYLVEDVDMEFVKSILNLEQEKAADIIEDVYDKNTKVEYDEEKTILPLKYSVNSIKNDSVKPTLGLIPKFIRQRERFIEVCEAIHRRYEANQEISIEWIKEYNELIDIVK